MQLFNILLALGGDEGNTIPKWRVTPSEIAVLRAIHGEGAVQEIEHVGDEPRTNRQERDRLMAIYSGAKTPDQKVIVNELFPGIAARLFQNIDELELPGELFKLDAPPRMAPVSEPSVDASDDFKLTEDATDEDGVGDMDDGPSEQTETHTSGGLLS